MKREQALPPKLRIKDIPAKVRKERQFSKRKHQHQFLDNDWWQDEAIPENFVTKDYLEKHKNWWAKVKQIIISEFEDNGKIICKTIPLSWEDGFSSPIYFRKPFYAIGTNILYNS